MASVPTGRSGQQIDLTKLSLGQLVHLKQQLEQELNVFQESLQALKMAKSKFKESDDTIESLKEETSGKQILVPLTSSMYVFGTLVDTENVLIEIGTGYYAQKDVESANDYFKRKVKFVEEQMAKVEYLGAEKSKLRDAINGAINSKLQAQSQAQKGTTA